MQNDMEAVHRRILDRRRANRSLPPYRAALISEIQQLLAAFFARQWPGTVVSGVRRVGGGASKEQFFFTLTHAGEDEEFLLRMDPRSAITETDRAREFHLIAAMQGCVPVPEPVWIDNDAEHFPQRSEEHTSELQSLMRISYAVFCLKKKKHTTQ